jgi:hypothetical protein
LLAQYAQKPSFKSLILVAVLFGMSTLCWPVALYYGVVVVIILFFGQRRKEQRAKHNLALRSPLSAFRSLPSALCPLLFAICFALTISPWFMRNKLLFGVANLTSLQGINLLLVNVAYLKAAQENLDYATAERLLEAEGDSLLAAKGLSTEKLKLIYHGKQYGYQVNDPQQARVYQTLALEKIMAAPVLYIRIHPWASSPIYSTPACAICIISAEKSGAAGAAGVVGNGGLGAAFRNFGRASRPGICVVSFQSWLADAALCAGRHRHFYLWKEKLGAAVALLLPIVYLLFVTAPRARSVSAFPAMPYLYLLSGLVLSKVNLSEVRSQ